MMYSEKCIYGHQRMKSALCSEVININTCALLCNANLVIITQQRTATVAIS